MNAAGTLFPILSNPLIGGYYLFDENPGFKRIRILDYEPVSRKAECVLVDFGIVAWLHYSNIFEIKTISLTITERSTRFSLADINILFEPNKIQIETIVRLLKNKYLIAEVQSLVEKSKDSEPIVQAIFYEMRNGEKINMNNEIAKANTKWFEPIHFDGDLMRAMISYINHDGTIYCHSIDNTAIQAINRLIEQLPQPEIISRYLAKKLSIGKFYLVFDESYKEWFRAVLMSSLGLDMIKMNFMDYGQERLVHKKNIYDMEKISAMLHVFPPQAIPVQLSKISRPTNWMSAESLQNQIKVGDMVNIDVIQSGVVPLVDIWKGINGKFVKSYHF